MKSHSPEQKLIGTVSVALFQRRYKTRRYTIRFPNRNRRKNIFYYNQ